MASSFVLGHEQPDNGTDEPYEMQSGKLPLQGTDFTQQHLQALSTPCLVLPPPPCPGQRWPGSMQTNLQTITLSHPRNRYQAC